MIKVFSFITTDGLEYSINDFVKTQSEPGQSIKIENIFISQDLAFILYTFI